MLNIDLSSFVWTILLDMSICCDILYWGQAPLDFEMFSKKRLFS